MDCPCGLAAPFAECCGPILNGDTAADTAERLMRSRYVAHATGHAEYLASSWAPETRPPDLHVVPGRRWVRLEIVDTERGRQLDRDGIVEFRAHWEHDGATGALEERSRFRRDNGRWVYVDGM
jgi:SEC-C motif-containing protein